LGKSSTGALISNAIAIGLKSGKVKIFDIYGNLLMDCMVNSTIRKIGSS
jgi:hypothetical protein